MTRSDVIDLLAQEQTHLDGRDVALAAKAMLEHMIAVIVSGKRIEIRGFGSFSLHLRPPRMGRNPKTGELVAVAGRYVPHFKPGKALRERVRGTQNIGRLKVAQRRQASADLRAI